MTSIQKSPGQKRLNSTMVYARVHDQTVADDHYSAVELVEQRLQIAPSAAQADASNDSEPLNDGERGRLLDLAEQLAEPNLRPEVRMELVDRIRLVLNTQHIA